MLAVVLSSRGAALVGDGVEEPILEEPERALVRLAKSPTRFDDFIENRL